MIIETILNFLKFLLTTVFGVLPSIPNISSTLVASIDKFIDLIFDNVGLLDLFLPINTIKIVIPIAIVIMDFQNIYDLTNFILSKIPFLNTK